MHIPILNIPLLYSGAIAQGAIKDLMVTIISTILSFILGTLGATARLYGPKLVKTVVYWYVEIIRGLPAILQLFIIYYGFTQWGIDFSPLTAALIWLVAYGTGYGVEIFRSGIIDVPQGQWEAASALGLSRTMTMFRIIVPQAYVAMLPPLTSFVVLQLKNTTLLYLVAYSDIMYQARLGTDATEQPGILYLMAALAYLIMSLAIGRLGYRLERRAAAYR